MKRRLQEERRKRYKVVGLNRRGYDDVGCKKNTRQILKKDTNDQWEDMYDDTELFFPEDVFLLRELDLID